MLSHRFSVPPHAIQPVTNSSRWLGICLLLIILSTSISQAEFTVSGNVEPTDPATWTSDTGGIIGNTADGSLRVDANSDLLSRGGIIGYKFGTVGKVTVDGIDSTWTLVNGSLAVGYEGSGVLNITNGGTVSSGYSYIGADFNAIGEVTVDGAGSSWILGGEIYVGECGSATLNITNGGIVSNKGGSCIGENSGSKGIVTVNGLGSSWTLDGEMCVGLEGSGTLSITNGGTVSNNWYGYICRDGDSIGKVTVDGTDSSWTIGRELDIGGTLTITNGGTVNSGYNSSIAGHSDSSGRVRIDGPDSNWTIGGDFGIGGEGGEMLTITNGGLVSVAGILMIDDNPNNSSFISMGPCGMLALYGDADASLLDFLNLIEGSDAIRYWNESEQCWKDITEAEIDEDYTLSYLMNGDLAGYTLLTIVPEPTTLSLLMLAGIALFRRR